MLRGGSADTMRAMKILKFSSLLFGIILVQSTFAGIRLDQIELPAGFKIEIYAEGVENARQMVRGDQGTIFAGTRRAGKLWAITDSDGDQRADKVRLIDEGLNMPSGVEFMNGNLYVGAVDRILRYDNIESLLDQPPEPLVITDVLPDKKLYIPVGVPCNICDKEGFGEIRSMYPDGSGMRTFASGVRNSVGLAFHPQNGQLWFTENGKDQMGDDIPADELNHAPESGMHFGIPYCHQGDILDEEFGKGKNCSDYPPPGRKARCTRCTAWPGLLHG